MGLRHRSCEDLKKSEVSLAQSYIKNAVNHRPIKLTATHTEIPKNLFPVSELSVASPHVKCMYRDTYI
jgi:hypothetical protein